MCIANNDDFHIGIFECLYYKKNSIINISEYGDHVSRIYFIDSDEVININLYSWEEREQNKLDKKLIYLGYVNEDDEECNYYWNKEDIFFIRYVSSMSDRYDSITSGTSLDDLQSECGLDDLQDVLEQIYEDVHETLIENAGCSDEFGFFSIKVPIMIELWSSWDSYSNDGDYGINYVGILDYMKLLSIINVENSGKCFLGKNYYFENKKKENKYWSDMSVYFEKK